MARVRCSKELESCDATNSLVWFASECRCRIGLHCDKKGLGRERPCIWKSGEGEVACRGEVEGAGVEGKSLDLVEGEEVVDPGQRGGILTETSDTFEEVDGSAKDHENEQGGRVAEGAHLRLRPPPPLAKQHLQSHDPISTSR